MPSHCAASRHGSQLARLVGRLTELSIRLTNFPGLSRTHLSHFRLLAKPEVNCNDLFASPVCWAHFGIPTLVEAFSPRSGLTKPSNSMTLSCVLLGLRGGRTESSTLHRMDALTFSITLKTNSKMSLQTSSLILSRTSSTNQNRPWHFSTMSGTRFSAPMSLDTTPS